MAAKKALPAPIDRPLSKAYLREFTGWSTAYPPGLSDPTSAQVMENILIGRDGSARIRPALQNMLEPDALDSLGHVDPHFVGGMEPFFLNSGDRAYLQAVHSGGVNKTYFVVLAPSTLYPGRYKIDEITDHFAVNEPWSGIHSPDTLRWSGDVTFVRYIQIDNTIMALPNSTNAADTLRLFTVGATKTATTVSGVTVPNPSNDAHAPEVLHPQEGDINPSAGWNSYPATAATPTTGTLVSSTSTDNIYNFGFFYTFTNELGETAASPMTVVKCQRRWSAWKWRKPNAAAEPAGGKTSIGSRCADQLVIQLPSAVRTQACTDRAKKWTVYMLTWSDQDNKPVEGYKIVSQDLTPDTPDADEGLVRLTPASSLYSASHSLPDDDPNALSNINYSTPPRSANGLVAGDRAVLVDDRGAGAVVRWSGNRAGTYTDFTPAQGGGLKTLSTGNLQVVVAAKLWQNPQSVDTITLLCTGVDGGSTGFYMAPAEVTGQTDTTTIMGFEETTASPGTTSPFGVEVFNNALYHPLEDQLMKSTANNYNISHKSQTDTIVDRWLELTNKDQIVSDQYDKRLYYIVTNPRGVEVPAGCMGNEIWVLDSSGDTGVWSRLLIPAVSLRRMERDGRLYMGVTTPQGVFILDDQAHMDQDHMDVETAIPWRIVTNTLGANRAHDQWAYVQQISVLLGNVGGTFRYGIRGHDQLGKYHEIFKTYRNPLFPDKGSQLMSDAEDPLLIRQVLKEWFFEASSVTEDGEVLPSTGQISSVQFLFTPSGRNIGYQSGDIQTFEYGHAGDPWSQRSTINGVPVPRIDPGIAERQM